MSARVFLHRDAVEQRNAFRPEIAAACHAGALVYWPASVDAKWQVEVWDRRCYGSLKRCLAASGSRIPRLVAHHRTIRRDFTRTTVSFAFARRAVMLCRSRRAGLSAVKGLKIRTNQPPACLPP